jgi:hypothetical protein
MSRKTRAANAIKWDWGIGWWKWNWVMDDGIVIVI